MYLIQLLLPVRDPAGRAINAGRFAEVRRTLTERYGGVTAYTRTPASGLWKTPEGDVERDAVVMVEVVVDALDREWWAAYRHHLEQAFDQQSIHVRALAVEAL